MQKSIRVGLATNSHYLSPLQSKLNTEKILNSGITFLKAEQGGTYDALIVLNETIRPLRVNVREGFTWKVIQEPQVDGKNPFVENHGTEFDVIYSHFEVEKDSRIRITPPLLPWIVERTATQLIAAPVPEKPRNLSIVASTKSLWPGHEKRNEFVNQVLENVPDIDVFGQGRRLISDKWDALAPYKYSIALENSSQPNYFTEKIVDCFATYTVPLYYGDPLIGHYFPEGSFVWLPVESPDVAIQIIQKTVASNDWSDRLQSITEARNLCLEKYNIYSYFIDEINSSRNQLDRAKFVNKTIRGQYSNMEYAARKILKKF